MVVAKGYSISLEKPLFDIKMTVDEDVGYVLPDFILSVSIIGSGEANPLVVETMGYTDEEYVERKASQHQGVAEIGRVITGPPK